jgi:large subunit ribosomal protein L31
MRSGKNQRGTHVDKVSHLTAAKVSRKIPDFLIAHRAGSTSFRAPFSKAMKDGIHPDYRETTIHCACGASYHTRSTRQNLKIGICAACHPFFTGEQKFVDTAGRIDKFTKRYANVPKRSAKKGAAASA